MASMSSPADLPTSIPTPGRGPPDPAAIKSRVITHMNNDHHLSLRLYLQHYNHVPSSGTKTAKVLDITTEHIIIESSFGRHVVPFDPPMKSLAESRERLVAMHDTCLKELDVSDVVVDVYTLPDRLWQWSLAALVILNFITFPYRESLNDTSSIFYRFWSLGGMAPWLAKVSYFMAPYTMAITLLAHAAEAVVLINGRLRRHWVEVGSLVWWLWVGDVMIEGGGALTRFDRVVRRAEERRKGGKH